MRNNKVIWVNQLMPTHIIEEKKILFVTRSTFNLLKKIVRWFRSDSLNQDMRNVTFSITKKVHYS